MVVQPFKSVQWCEGMVWFQRMRMFSVVENSCFSTVVIIKYFGAVVATNALN